MSDSNRVYDIPRSAGRIGYCSQGNQYLDRRYFKHTPTAFIAGFAGLWQLVHPLLPYTDSSLCDKIRDSMLPEQSTRKIALAM